MSKNSVWWANDADGRRIGYMHPVEFEAICASHYGEKGWVRKFCADFDLSPSNVYRYREGETPIPKVLAMAIQMMDALGGPDEMPKVDAPWLPEREVEEADAA